MEHNEIKPYLASHPEFTNLTDRQLDILTAHASEQHVGAGDALFNQDDAADRFYILLKGQVSVQIPSLSGPPLEVQMLSHNNVLGWSWLIAPFKWTFEARAEQASSLLVFDGLRLRAECEADPAFGYALLKRFARLMSERLQAARLKMMESFSPAGWA